MNKQFLRRLSLAIIVLLAIAVPLGLAPTRPDTHGYNQALQKALDDANTQEADASGAPQQAVVNGWLARDLMEIQIKQNNDMLTYQHSIAVLLVVAVLAVCWSAGWGSSATKRDDEQDGDELPTTVGSPSRVG